MSFRRCLPSSGNATGEFFIFEKQFPFKLRRGRRQNLSRKIKSNIAILETSLLPKGRKREPHLVRSQHPKNRRHRRKSASNSVAFTTFRPIYIRARVAFYGDALSEVITRVRSNPGVRCATYYEAGKTRGVRSPINGPRHAWILSGRVVGFVCGQHTGLHRARVYKKVGVSRPGDDSPRSFLADRHV